MNLEIRLFAALKCDNRELACFGQDEFRIDVPDSLTVEELHRLLGLDKPTLITLVNGLARTKDFTLNDNDRVGIFPPVGGG